MRGEPRIKRWLAWALCAALLGGVCSAASGHAQATSAKVAPKPGAKATRKSSTKPTNKSSAKPTNKSSTKAAKTHKATKQRDRVHAASTARSKAVHHTSSRRAAQAGEPLLDVDTGPDAPCHTQLRKAGVAFVKLSAERAPGVQLPARLTGPVAGIEIRGTGKNRATEYLDCRLGLALSRWAPALEAAGVVRVDHYSIYRPDAEVGGTRKPSGHARALAIDAGRFHLRDGRVLTVLESWSDKTKGADPCANRPLQSEDERLLRELVCDAARRGIFQTIVTPHHNPEHDNHVHLEVSEAFAPTWIH